MREARDERESSRASLKLLRSPCFAHKGPVMQATQSFFAYARKIIIHPGKLHCPFFVPEKLARLFVMREVKPSADRKMIKLVTVHNLFNYDNLANLKNLLFSENF